MADPNCAFCGDTHCIDVIDEELRIFTKKPCPYCTETGQKKPHGIINAELRRNAAHAALRKYRDNFAENFNGFAALVSQLNSLWEVDLQGEPIEPDFPEMLMLVVCECSEAMEGHRKDAMDKKHPHRKNFDVEIADAIIRLFHIAARRRIDIGNVIADVLAYNVVRPDHQWSERIKRHGKKI